MTRGKDEPIVTCLGDDFDTTLVAKLIRLPPGAKGPVAHFLIQQATGDGPPQAIHFHLSTAALLDLGLLVSYLCHKAAKPGQAAKPVPAAKTSVPE